MKTLSLHEFAYPAVSAFGIGEKNTISNGPDDGTLNCNVAHFWNPMRHGTTQQAMDNALTAMVISVSPATSLRFDSGGALSAGGLNLCGHGNDGLIETGMGQNGPYDDNKIILPWNEFAWGPQLDRLRPSSVTYVSLWACHPGAGQEGADLLYAMAQHCGRAVRGGTGFLYCSAQQLYWENGSVWQVATPTNKPAPIQAPTPHRILMANLRFEIQGREYGPGDVVQFELEPRAISATPSNAVTKTLHGASAQAAASNLFRSEPMDMKVGISAMVTAMIRITFAEGSVAEFVVLNDRLAVDTKSRVGYYIASARSLYDLI